MPQSLGAQPLTGMEIQGQEAEHKTAPEQAPTDMTALLEVEALTCHYDSQLVLEEVGFRLNPGEIGCILGPSGCGKSTLLRTIAGFHPISAGEIRLAGKLLASRTQSIPPEKRQIGMVFQDYALFPHLTVLDNVRFGLGRGKEAMARALGLLELVGLADLARRYPHELSGGQQQRIALARALAPKPRLVLMDEPFSNLDVTLRKRLSLDVRDILKRAGTSAILVTHDQQEAFAMSDHIGVIQQGRLLQWDTAANLYHAPATRFVAQFVGNGTFLPGTVRSDGHIDTELGPVTSKRPGTWTTDQAVDILIRPDDLVFDQDATIQAQVISKVFAGSSTLYQVRLESNRTLEILAPSHNQYQEGEQVGLRLKTVQLLVFESTFST